MQPFSIILGLGTFAGLLLVAWRVPQNERLRYLDAAILVLFGALLGSRSAAVVANWAYYQNHLVEIFQVWQGGLFAVGAIVGGMLVILILSRAWKIPLGTLADAMLPLAGSLAVAVWMGCWLDGCSYGITTNAWWASPARDEFGVVSNRVPVQLTGAILTLILIWLLDWGSSYLPVRGLGASIGLLGLSAVVFGLSYLRADPTQIWRGLRLDAWEALSMMVISSVVVVVLLARWIAAKNRKSAG